MGEKIDVKAIIASAARAVEEEAAKGIKKSVSVSNETAPLSSEKAGNVQAQNTAVFVDPKLRGGDIPDVDESGVIKPRRGKTRSKKQKTAIVIDIPKTTSTASTIDPFSSVKQGIDLGGDEPLKEVIKPAPAFVLAGVSSEEMKPKEKEDLLKDIRTENEARLQTLQEEEGSLNTSEVGENKDRDSEKSEKIIERVETIDEKIVGLKNSVAIFRAKYVEEDHETMSTLDKLRNILGRNVGKDIEGQAYQEYKKELSLLKDAELEKLQSSSKIGEALKKEMEDLSHYFKLDEAVNLINERTQYKAENQTFSEKILDSVGALGRAYNRIPLKGKLAITAAFLGITVATAMSGGSGTAVGALAFVSVVRKVASGAGVAVGTEALLESFGERGRKTQAEKETKEQIGTLEMENLNAKPEVNFDALNAFLDKDIASLDVKLQNEKKAKIWRKVGAAGFGALVGSGWLTQFAMDHLGGHVAVDWAKEHIGSVLPEKQIPESPRMVLPDDVMEAAKAADMKAATEYMSASPLEQAQIREVTGMTDEKLRALATQLKDILPSGTPALPEVGAVKPDLIGNFINEDIIVQKGDSVWKIAGGLADKLELEDTQRTHFIDALKDQYGDVHLKAGETINFSEHGIDKDFVENALAHAKGLTEGQMASINANDVKIEEFAASHPDVTLTNESVDKILHENAVDTSTLTENAPMIDDVSKIGNPTNPLDFGEEAARRNIVSVDQIANEVSSRVETGTSSVVPPQEAISPSEPVFTAELQPRVSDWYMQIFRVENPALGQDWIVDKGKIGSANLMDMMRDARLYKEGSFTGYKTGLNMEQIKNFADFSQNVEKNSNGFNKKAFFMKYPNATVMDYLKKVAPLVKQGQRLGLYTTTQ